MDIGTYEIKESDSGMYTVTEILSGEVRHFSSIKDMMIWIEQSVREVAR